MTSREEREEVAKKLRHLTPSKCVHPNYTSWYTDICAAIGGKKDSWLGISALAERLADLIDPTCKYLPITCATWFDDNDEEHEDTSLEALGNSENAYCSFCGYEMMTGEEGWFDYERKEHGNRLIPLFNYCPDCGARVVRDA